MRHFFQRFRQDEDGAISAEWVILTAGMVIFAGAVATLVKDGAIQGGENISDKVVAQASP